MGEVKKESSETIQGFTQKDFFALKFEVKEIMHQVQSMQSAILFKLGGILATVIVVAVSASFGALFYINDSQIKFFRGIPGL